MGRSKNVNAQQNCTNANDVRAAYGSKAVHNLDSGRENSAVIDAINDILIGNSGEINQYL
jgi:hypothetical protein